MLCLQGGSDLNYNNLDQCRDLGVIGNNKTDAKSRGLHLHSKLAITPDGLPLEVVKADCVAPKPKKDKRKSIEIPIEEKKTFCWIQGLRDCMALKAQMPHTRLINVLEFGIGNKTGCQNRRGTLIVFMTLPLVIR